MIILKALTEHYQIIIPGLLLGIVSILLGIYFFKKPEDSWKHRHRRFTSGGKPSEYHIVVEKIKGVFVIIMGITMIILSILFIIDYFLPIF